VQSRRIHHPPDLSYLIVSRLRRRTTAAVRASRKVRGNGLVARRCERGRARPQRYCLGSIVCPFRMFDSFQGASRGVSEPA
jgi:hypothetical protein